MLCGRERSFCSKKRGCSRGGCAEEWGGERGAQREQGKAVEQGRCRTGVLARADEWQLCIGLGAFQLGQESHIQMPGAFEIQGHQAPKQQVGSMTPGEEEQAAECLAPKQVPLYPALSSLSILPFLLLFETHSIWKKQCPCIVPLASREFSQH